MKILVFLNDTTYAYNLRREIIEYLLSGGNQVVVVCQRLHYADQLAALGCQLVPLEIKRHSTNPMEDLLLFFRFRKILRDEKPDVVLTYNIKPNVYGGLACRLSKTPYIPNITGLGTPIERPGWIRRLSMWLYRQGIAGAACVMFQNRDNLRFFREFHLLPPECRTRLLPGSGVSPQVHQALPYPPETPEIHFLFISRILREKGIDLYLDAARTITARHPNTVFHVCGYCDDPAYLTALRQAQENGVIVYHGEQPDLLPFYRMAHCVVHPSYYPEGMSNVLLEAASHARPIIATDRPGCRETVEDRVSGYLIPIQDGQALIDALESFLSLDAAARREMGQAGRRKMEREFDRKFVVQAYAEEIAAALGAGGQEAGRTAIHEEREDAIL